MIMYKINKHIFIQVCNSNFEIYEDLINTINLDYDLAMQELSAAYDCKQIRQIIHKLVGFLSLFEDDFVELYSLFRLLLIIDEQSIDVLLYRSYVDIILQYDIKDKLLT